MERSRTWIQKVIGGRLQATPVGRSGFILEAIGPACLSRIVRQKHADLVKWALHLLSLALTMAFYTWAVWLANSRQPASGSAQSFRAVLPYRIIVLLLSPFFLWSSWREWGGPNGTGAIFLVVAVGCVPVAAWVFTLRVTLDDNAIQLRHAFVDKRVRYDEIATARLREWTGEYVIRGRDGTKIVFPTWLEGAAHVFESCQPKRERGR
jgi:hypothetical protein